MMMDEKQRMIIRELQKNAKQSLRDIGKNLDLPVSTIYSRIQKMEDEKIIDSYKTLFNADKLGFSAVAIILVRLKFSDITSKKPYDFKEIARQLAVFPEIQEVHLIAGDWDLFLKVRGADTKAIGQFVVDRLRPIEGLDRCVILMVFDTAKETTDLPI